MLFDEESKQHVTVNTHLGLFCCTGLPFGVASSPAIFQNIVDSVMSDLQCVGGIFDDLIITGSNDGKHLSNL